MCVYVCVYVCVCVYECVCVCMCIMHVCVGARAFMLEYTICVCIRRK